MIQWAHELNRQFSEVQMANKYMKNSSIPLDIKEMQTKNDTEISSHPIQNSYPQQFKQ
jgi:hypothetical protein